jgi:hypothetical protein
VMHFGDLEALAWRSQRELQALTALLHEAEATTRAAIEALESGAVRVFRARSERGRGRALADMAAAIERSAGQFTEAAALARALAREARAALDTLATQPRCAPQQPLVKTILAVEAEARRLADEAETLVALVVHLRARGQHQLATSR